MPKDNVCSALGIAKEMAEAAKEVLDKPTLAYSIPSGTYQLFVLHKASDDQVENLFYNWLKTTLRRLAQIFSVVFFFLLFFFFHSFLSFVFFLLFTTEELEIDFVAASSRTISFSLWPSKISVSVSLTMHKEAGLHLGFTFPRKKSN